MLYDRRGEGLGGYSLVWLMFFVSVGNTVYWGRSMNYILAVQNAAFASVSEAVNILPECGDPGNNAPAFSGEPQFQFQVRRGLGPDRLGPRARAIYDTAAEKLKFLAPERRVMTMPNYTTSFGAALGGSDLPLRASLAARKDYLEATMAVFLPSHHSRMETADRALVTPTDGGALTVRVVALLPHDGPLDFFMTECFNVEQLRAEKPEIYRIIMRYAPRADRLDEIDGSRCLKVYDRTTEPLAYPPAISSENCSSESGIGV